MIYFTGPIGEGKTVAVTGVVTVINALLGTSKVIKNGKIVTSQGDISHQSTATSNRLIIMTSRNPNDIFIILLDLRNIFVLGTFLNILSDGLNIDSSPTTNRGGGLDYFKEPCQVTTLRS